MTPLFSIIIPCYNDGKYLPDAIESLRNCEASLFELIIVNDGSKDEATITYLKKLEIEGYKVIHQQNKGLSGARNKGISKSNGKYIVPLDSDNKLRPEYLLRAKTILEHDENIAVVYGRPQHFGANSEVPYVGDFNLQRLMLGNYIDACAIYRKSVWEKTGGYDEQMRLGLEDWEFWLRIAFNGYKFQFINEVLFDYRVRPDSMARTDTKDRYNFIVSYVEQKHKYFMSFDAISAYIKIKYKDNYIVFIIKTLLFMKFHKLFDIIIRKGFIRKL